MFSKRVGLMLRPLFAFPECRRSVCTHSGACADLQVNICAQCASITLWAPGCQCLRIRSPWLPRSNGRRCMLQDSRSSRGDSERIQPPLTQIGGQQVICDLVSYCSPLLLQLQRGGSFLPSEPAPLEVAPRAASRAQGCWPGAPRAPPRPSCGQGGGEQRSWGAVAPGLGGCCASDPFAEGGAEAVPPGVGTMPDTPTHPTPA